MTTPTHSHKAWTDEGGHVTRASDVTVMDIGSLAADSVAGPRPGLRPARLLRADQPHPLGPGFLTLRQPQLLAGEDDSPAQPVAETNREVAWPSGEDAAVVLVHKSVDGLNKSHQLLHSGAGLVSHT